MGKIKIFKNFIPILLGLMVILSPFGNFKAFAATATSDLIPVGTVGYVNNGVLSPTGTASTAVTDNNDAHGTSTSRVGLPGSYSFYIKLPKEVNVSSFYLSNNGPTIVKFYDSSGNLLSSYNAATAWGSFNTSVKNVAQVLITNATGNAISLWEFDLDGYYTSSPPQVGNLTVTNSGNEGAKISYTIPQNNPDYTGSKIYRDGTLIATQSATANTYTDSNLGVGNTYTYKVTATYSGGIETSGVSVSYTTPSPPKDVTNVKTMTEWDKVTLSWDNPSSNFSSVNIYRDGQKIGNVTDSSFVDAAVSPKSNYSYVLKAVSPSGLESNGVQVTATIPQKPAPADVTNLNLKANWNNVELTWNNPSSQTFYMVNIYRDGVLVGTTSDESFTDFSDIKPTTQYTYTVKAANDIGAESNGVSENTVTPQEQKPVLENPKFTQQQNGDVKITWDGPTTGTMQITVGGKLYKTVNAADQQYIVVSADVIRNPFGDLDMYITPVSENGVKGDPVQSPKFDNVKTPFDANDLAKTGFNLLWLIAPFLLLALAFLLVPKLRKLLFDSIRRIRGKETKEQTRRTDQEPREQRERERETRERHEGKEHLEKVGLSPGKEPREERERQERQQRNRELKEFTELATKEPRNPRIRAERAEKGGRVQRITKTLREPRERIRQARERHREQRESTRQPRQPRQPRGSRGDY